MPVQYNYISTHSMGLADFTERQYLYSTSTALLQLWAVQTVQNLSACIVQLYFNTTYGP